VILSYDSPDGWCVGLGSRPGVQTDSPDPLPAVHRGVSASRLVRGLLERVSAELQLVEEGHTVVCECWDMYLEVH
jgi:hypothetical protein